MTIKQYMDKYKVKRKQTVEKWITSGFIPNVKKINGEWILPETARKPYTNNRIKVTSTSQTIYRSILKACNKRQYISADIYKMDKTQFYRYISDLLDNKLIRQYNEEGIEEYHITSQGVDFLKNKLSVNEVFDVAKLVVAIVP